MSNTLEHIIRTTIKDVLSEQESNVQANVFNDSHKKFLGTFANAGSKHLGIIYSVSDIGIREFVSRSGTQYNCTPEIKSHTFALGSLIVANKEVKVAVSNGYLNIKEMQIPGKRKMDIKSLLNGYSFEENSKMM